MLVDSESAELDGQFCAIRPLVFGLSLCLPLSVSHDFLPFYLPLITLVAPVLFYFYVIEQFIPAMFKCKISPRGGLEADTFSRFISSGQSKITDLS